MELEQNTEAARGQVTTSMCSAGGAWSSSLTLPAEAVPHENRIDINWGLHLEMLKRIDRKMYRMSASTIFNMISNTVLSHKRISRLTSSC